MSPRGLVKAVIIATALMLSGCDTIDDRISDTKVSRTIKTQKGEYTIKLTTKHVVENSVVAGLPMGGKYKNEFLTSISITDGNKGSAFSESVKTEIDTTYEKKPMEGLSQHQDKVLKALLVALETIGVPQKIVKEIAGNMVARVVKDVEAEKNTHPDAKITIIDTTGVWVDDVASTLNGINQQQQSDNAVSNDAWH